jgi:hypothetical protein
MKFFESILGWLLDAATFLDNLKPRRGDDALTARHRTLKRACVWSTVAPFVLLGFAFLVANAFNAFSDALHNAAPIEVLRPAISYVALGAVVVSVLVAFYNLWRLWKFERGEDDLV